MRAEEWRDAVPSHSVHLRPEPQKSIAINPKQNATRKKCSGDAAAKAPHWCGAWGSFLLLPTWAPYKLFCFGFLLLLFLRPFGSHGGTG